jgi:phosphoribosylpyrophosphate synthetase
MVMINKPRLVVIPGVGKNSEDLAIRVKEILENDFNVGNDVDIFNPGEEIKGMEPDPRSPFTQGYFKDKDPKAEAGKLTLQRAINNNYVAIVRYMDDRESEFSINDDLFQLWAIGNLLDNVATARRVLALPYTPYLRSHSNRKYHEKGLAKAYSMGMFVEVLKKTGIDRLITIEPHARTELHEVARREYGIDTTFFSPFDDPLSLNNLKLGAFGRKNDLMNKLGYFKTMIEKEFHDAYLIAVDNGAEKTSEDMVYRIRGAYDKILAFTKMRTGEGQNKIIGLKSWCNPDLEKLKGGTALIIDDMISSGSTANDTAKYVKDKYSVEKVILFTAHPVCPVPEKIKIDNLDKIYTLGTVPHRGIERLNIVEDVHPYMLAAGLYKSWSRHVDRMELEMNFGR